jgi:Glycosyl transferase 4-like domain
VRRHVTIVSAGITATGAVGSRIHAFGRGLTRRGWRVDLVDLTPLRASPARAILDDLPSSVSRALERAGVEGDVQPVVGWRAVRALHAVPSSVVVLSLPPFSLLAAAAAIPHDVPVVLDFRDPWNARVHPPPMARMTRVLERAAARRAAAVTYAGGPALGHLLAATLQIPGDRIMSVPNGFDPHDLADVPPPTLHFRRDGTPLDLVFGGYWYGRNGPGILATALDRVGPEIATLTVIGGSAPTIPIRAVRRPPLARPALYARLSRADAAVITLDHASAIESRIPAKAYDCLAVGGPVIAICPEDAALLTLPGTARFHHIHQDDTDSLVALLRAAAADRSVLRLGTQGEGPTRDLGADALHAVLCGVVSL